MMIELKEIMTHEETVKYLRTENSTFYKMARESKIPAVKVVL